MAPSASPVSPETVFRTTLLDGSGQPNLVIDSSESHQLTWTLVNNATTAGQNLVVVPFSGGTVGPTQYHFKFGFAPGALTAAPTLQGWNVAVDKETSGDITALYIALAGNTPLSIAPNDSYKTSFTYTSAIQKDPNQSTVHITLTADANVSLGGSSVKGKSFGPFNLKLVQANVASLSAPPISVDFVGRRSVLNDGYTSNSFTFALTNMTTVDIPLTPAPASGLVTGTAPTVFSVWFDAAPNDPQVPYPWALAQVQDLDAVSVALALPSPDWRVKKDDTLRMAVTGNPQWAITVANAVVLAPQAPLLFTFSGIKTNLDPGVTRMYLKYSSLGNFADGVLIAELAKSPVLYGAARGQGLYVSAGTYRGSAPPAPNYTSGLYVQQFGGDPAATFNGGSGVVIQVPSGPAAQLNSGAVINAGSQEISGLAINAANGQPALSINQTGTGPAAQIQGKVGITPNPRLEISRGSSDQTELSLNERLFLDGSKGTVRVTNNAYRVNDAWRIADTSKKAFTLEIRDTGVLDLYGTVTAGQADWRKLASFDGPGNQVIFPGSVGVGATGPQAALDVNGDVMMSGVVKGRHTVDQLIAYLKEPMRPGLPTEPWYQKAMASIVSQGAGIIQGFSYTASLHPPHQYVIMNGHPSSPDIKMNLLDLTSGNMKTFVLDHPLDHDRYLVHASLEGPEGAVYYRGTARLYKGEAHIQLPDYFEALARLEGRTILLTNLDGFDRLAVRLQDGAKIKDGVFIVESADRESSQAFDWEVKAIRSDVAPLEVEPSKSDTQVAGFGPYTYRVPRNGNGVDGHDVKK